MASFFLWTRGLRAPSPVIVSGNATASLTALDKTRQLSAPKLLTDADVALGLDLLARLYPVPPQPEEPQ